MKLNLGCGARKLAGYVNVDVFDTFAPDLVHNLEDMPWPFGTNSVDEIVMHHVLEHLGADADTFIAIMKELYRISRPSAVLDIVVPHPRSDDFLGDPTHVRPILPETLALFSKEHNRKTIERGLAATPLGLYHDIDFRLTSSEHRLTPHWHEIRRRDSLPAADLKHAIASFSNVVAETRIVLTAVKDAPATARD